MSLHDEDRTPANDPNTDPMPDDPTRPDASEHQTAAAEQAPADAITPAVVFLLQAVKVQNPDLTNTVNDHLRSIGNGSSTPPTPPASPRSSEGPLRQSGRFRGRS